MATTRKEAYQNIILMLFCLCFASPIEMRYTDKDLNISGGSPFGGISGSSSSSGSGIGYSASGSGGSRKREKTFKQPHMFEVPTTVATSTATNLCSKDRDMKLVCHCSPEDYFHIRASKAECWIFHDDFPRKDPNWLAFHTQSYLEHLKFTVQRTGHLGYIPTDVIGALKLLKVISIEYAQINEINSYAFANLSRLTSIELPKNQIRILYRYAFANHPDLDDINLEQNTIVDIDQHAFVDLPNLKVLNLAKNNISLIHEDLFGELRKLIDLRLDSNSISVLTREMFKGLGNLQKLRISNNNVNFIGDAVFAELWGLQELELDSNHIEVSESHLIFTHTTLIPLKERSEFK